MMDDGDMHILPDGSGFFVAEVGPRERPPLSILRYVNPVSFGPQHLEQLRRLEEHMWDGTTAVQLALRIAQGDVWLWEVGEDEHHAIVLLSLVVTPQYQILWIEGAAGDGILARAPSILADIRSIAHFYACGRIRASSDREGFDSLPDKLGFEKVSIVWELEIDDGRQLSDATDATDGHAED